VITKKDTHLGTISPQSCPYLCHLSVPVVPVVPVSTGLVVLAVVVFLTTGLLVVIVTDDLGPIVDVFQGDAVLKEIELGNDVLSSADTEGDVIVEDLLVAGELVDVDASLTTVGTPEDCKLTPFVADVITDVDKMVAEDTSGSVIVVEDGTVIVDVGYVCDSVESETDERVPLIADDVILMARVVGVTEEDKPVVKLYKDLLESE